MYIVRQMIHKAIRMDNWILMTGSILFIIMSTYLFYWLEPETFKTPFNALWYVMTTVTTVGYGDYSPVTVPGQIYAMIVYIIGIGVIGVAIGKVVDGLASYKRKREEGRLRYKGKDHIVIIGWSRKAEIAVQEILDTSTDIEIVIIDLMEKTPIQHERIFYIRGRATEKETLENAGLERARSAIVFADESIDDQQLIDGKTLLISSTIEAYASDIKTMVEIMDERHVGNFSYINVNEFILPSDMVSRLAVRATFNNGISSIYNQLVRRGSGENLYQIHPKPQWDTYKTAFDELLRYGATLVADGDDLTVNRQLEKPIAKNAQLYIICDEPTYQAVLDI
ncbi:potassium channel family protein [Tuberibacillus sp. Marseille-P3662]|uniref:potassium channel family protein n=1 Tax=Tuberibacillus sp. Marseille-P3662 TaxID=1965358 RepID=UPI000A1CD6ED|nr:potassium channel family protein [Tuberibacillus sp. Marseille-P3662]